MEKCIAYVESHSCDKNQIINDIAMNGNIGASIATNRVNTWLQNYSAFIYDRSNGNLLMYNLRTRGYWEVDMASIVQYKL